VDRTTGPLFPTRDGRRLTSRQVARRLAGWLEAAGITRRASPHTLRHSFATQLYRKTGDILLVREALRHRSIASTLVYARVDGERLRRALG
jgi:site-specific recombinase XerD